MFTTASRGFHFRLEPDNCNKRRAVTNSVIGNLSDYHYSGEYADLAFDGWRTHPFVSFLFDRYRINENTKFRLWQHRFYSALDIAYAGILSRHKQLDIRRWPDDNKRKKSGFLHPIEYLNHFGFELFRGSSLIQWCINQFNLVQQPDCELLFGFHGELRDHFDDSLGKQSFDINPGNKQPNQPLDERHSARIKLFKFINIRHYNHFYHFNVHFYYIIYHQYINIESSHSKFVHHNYSYYAFYYFHHVYSGYFVKHIEHLKHVKRGKHSEHFDIHDFNLHGFDYTGYVDNHFDNSNHSDLFLHPNHLNYRNYPGHSNYSDYCSHSDHVDFHLGSSNYSDYHIHSDNSDYSDQYPHPDYSNHSDHSDYFNVHYLDHLDHLHYSDVNPGSRLSNRWPTVQLPANRLPRPGNKLSNIAGNSEVNALGYNARDDYLYAVAQNGLLTSISIIRLNARGDVSVVVPQVANKLALLGGFNAGDVDENSQYWISTSGNDWYQYDLRPGSATYAQQVAYGTLPLLSRPAQVIADWAYVPGGGNFLWAIGTASGGRTVLMQFSRSTKRWTQVRDFGNIVGGTLLNQPVWGAVYASANGFLYGTENLTGQVWRFPVLSSTAPATSVVTGSPATLNDGARCLEASNLPT
ncbi:proline rich protein 5MeD [Verticillium dahliae]|nr:proline rich protein 5MeD [Verticillium dahliae]